jgi:hypothetical protein
MIPQNKSKVIKDNEVELLTFVASTQAIIFALGEYFATKKKTVHQLRDKLKEEFKTTHGFNPDEVMAFGPSTVSNQFAVRYIERVRIKPGILKGDWVHSYKCFCNTDMIETSTGPIERWKTNADNLILHEDGESAWKCLMETLNHPEFGYITQVLRK